MRAPIGLDEQVFLAHLGRGPFQSGVERGRWRLIAMKWPAVRIAVSVAERPNGPSEYTFLFDCRDYPQQPPTARLWDEEQQLPLPFDRWPGGGGRVALAFNPGWHGGECLYLPCDRLSIVGHDPWRTQHPEMIWTAASDITLYLKVIHGLLNSGDYTGPRGA